MKTEQPLRTECPVCGNRELWLHGNERFYCRACKATFSRRPRACILCGAPIPHGRKKNTCSDECDVIKKRNRDLEHYHRRTAADPLYNRKKREAYKKTPNFTKVMQGQEARRWQRIKEDPERWEKQKEKMRQVYARHADKIQKRRRLALAKLSPEKLAEKIQLARERSRKFAEEKRKQIKKDPQAYQKHLNSQQEYRRRRALARLMELNMELKRRLSKGESNEQ